MATAVANKALESQVSSEGMFRDDKTEELQKVHKLSQTRDK